MLIGVPKEIKNHEYRIGLTPAGVRELVSHGHQVMVQRDGGKSIGLTNEMYEKAGIPVPKILQIATIDAARFMKDDANYGSVTVGKVADLLVVAGRPAERVGDLQKVETVIRGGRYYKVADLLSAAGLRIGPGRNGLDGDDGCAGGFSW